MALLGTKLGWRLPCLHISRFGHSPSTWKSYTTSTDATVDVKLENEAGTEKPLDSPKRKKRALVPYTEEEISKARKFFNDGIGIQAMISHFPGRTVAGLGNALHRSALGTPVKQGRRVWSLEETKELVAMCEKGASSQELFEKFPYRSQASILAKRKNEMSKSAEIRKQGVGRRKVWTAEESALLSKLARQGLSMVQVAAKLGRSSNSVNMRFWKIHRDGMETWPALKEWNSQDAALMRLQTDGYSLEETAKILRRSCNSVTSRWKAIRPRSADGRPLTRSSSVSKLSDTDFSHIAHMRQSRNSWPAVQESRWPDRMDTQVRKAFHEACVQRITEAESRASPKEGPFEHNFSDADLARIGRLREEGDSWAIDFTSMNYKSTLGAFKTRYLRYLASRRPR